MKEDFPAFGLPTTQNLGNGFSSSTASGNSGKTSTILSNNYPVPLPLIPEIVKYSPNPKL